MESVDDCFDNALCESFFATLECELIDWPASQTIVRPQTAVFLTADFLLTNSATASKAGLTPPMNINRRNQIQFFSIRRYEDSDFKEIWNLHHLALKEINAHPGSKTWDEDLRFVMEKYINSGGEFVVGTYKKRIIAMGALKRISDNCAAIKRMRVHPRFQRRGFGQKILDSLEARAKELGYIHLQLWTTERQKAAQEFYTKNGYNITKRKKSEDFRVILFEKTLKLQQTTNKRT